MRRSDTTDAGEAGLGEGATAATSQDASALIDHILARYQAVHRRELPEPVRLAQVVEAAHHRR